MRFKIYIAVLLSFISYHVIAQNKPAIPLMRVMYHDNIVKTQRKIDRLDGQQDHKLSITGNTEFTNKATTALFTQVDSIRNYIEIDSTLNFNNKMKYLRGLNEVLIAFEMSVRQQRGGRPEQMIQLIPAFIKGMELERQGSSIQSLIEGQPLAIGEMLLSSFMFTKNPGYAESVAFIERKKLELKPDEILPALRVNPNVSSADSLIKTVAYINPEDIYTYAQAGDELANRIQNSSDPLVSTISKLAKLNTGRLYFPFLDNLYHGKMTMSEVDSNMNDKYKYFRMLVTTEIDYAGRYKNGDTPLVMSTLRGMIKRKAVEDFINVINGLHESPDNIRMREVEPLNSQELYYLCVMGDPEIYTSSYLKVYDRMFQRLKVQSSDTLLALVNADFFKKFIKMAAAYNRLDHFLNNMHKGNAEALMKSFAKNLEKTNTLEDAVDVADAYSSISNEALRKLIYNEIQSSYSELMANNNRRGVVIYDILSSIFQSLDPANKINLSAKFGIPPVYAVKNKSLRDSAGRIVIEQYFYGDKDGNREYGNFRAAYSNSNWKTINKPEWIETYSTRGTPITIYSNKPLDGEKELDAKAQSDLNNYLDDKGQSPTIVIHRGHSYFVNYTIKQLAPTAKVVLLGSCGGYHNIHSVLKIAPNAHIIASKQVGSGSVNQPMIVNITEDLRQGKDLNWPQKWRQFAKIFANKDLFDDYIPPHKNLGAIFIMAYKKTFGEDRS